MKIESTIGKRFEFVELSGERYRTQRINFMKEFNIKLPFYHLLKNFGKLKDLRILTKRQVVTVTRKNSRYTQVEFGVGYITDLASVPKFMRGLIDNDNPVMLNAVLLHDYNCSTHNYSFKETNRLFYDMLLEAGYSRFKSWVAWVAVSSPTGKRYWKKNGVRRKNWTLETCRIQEAR